MNIQKNNLENLKTYLNEYINKWNFSGVVSVVKDGNIILHQASGFACMEFGIKNTLETCFSLASISKQFTAFCILKLVDENKIKLQESANKYLPNDLLIDSRITVHHLLSHTSGLYNFYSFDDDFFGEYNRLTFSRKDFFDRYINQAIIFNPGTQFNYNNSNYNILAWMIEYLSGQSLGDYLEENIFIPLNMENSILDYGTSIIPNKAYLYDYDREGIVKCQYYNDKFSIGAGAIVSNCFDLIKWHNCLQNKKILSETAYEIFFTVNENNYCYGIESHTIHDKKCYSHGGDNLGIMTYMGNFFDDDLLIIILSNAGFGNQYKMNTAICDILFTGKHLQEVQPPTIHLSDEDAEKYEGIYLDKKIELRRHNGNWEFVRFNGELRIPIRPIGNHQFLRIDYDKYEPYTLTECEDGTFEFFGFKKLEQIPFQLL